MNVSIGCDAHRKYSQFAILDGQGQVQRQARVIHERGNIREFLADFAADTPVALESVGNWYWIADEIEAAGCIPMLTHAAKAKMMMGHVNKTDKLDAKGLATLLHNGTLPSIWIPPNKIRDKRELPRTRMALTKLKVALKNRIHATLAKYAITLPNHSDIFAGKGRQELEKVIGQLPLETGRCVQQELQMLDALQGQISVLEERIKGQIRLTPSTLLVKTLPGVADILAIVIEGEIGDINRFPTAQYLCSYAGVVPTVHASGGKTRYGHMRKQSNQYLKWAFIEAANVIVRHRRHPSWDGRHVCLLYERIRHRKGHSIAVGAVARHLAEATFWILKKEEPYREPLRLKGSSKQVSARA